MDELVLGKVSTSSSRRNLYQELQEESVSRVAGGICIKGFQGAQYEFGVETGLRQDRKLKLEFSWRNEKLSGDF